MRRLKYVLLAVAVAGLTMGLAACGGDDDGPGEASLDLTVGDIIPLSGDLAVFGPPGEKAANLAVEKINEAIDEAGVNHTVNITHEDTQTRPAGARSAAEKVIADGATCIAGAWASASSIPVAESVTIPEGILQISPASTSDEITDLDDAEGVVNRTAPPDKFQGPTLADVMEAELGGAEGTTVNIGARNDAYGTGLAGTFRTAWEDKGGEVGEEVVYDPEQPSYDSEAGQLTEGDPDGWAIIDFPETYDKVGPALVRTGNWDVERTFVTDGLLSSALPEDAGEEATEGMRGTAPGAPDEGSPTDEFDADYEDFAPRGVERGTFDAQNFDAVMLCYLAAVAAGSTEGTDMAEEVREISGPPGDTYTYLQLPDAIQALQDGDEIDYNGASGEIDMDDAGDATAGVYDIFRYRNGEVDIFDETDIATLEED